VEICPVVPIRLMGPPVDERSRRGWRTGNSSRCPDLVPALHRRSARRSTGLYRLAEVLVGDWRVCAIGLDGGGEVLLCSLPGHRGTLSSALAMSQALWRGSGRFYPGSARSMQSSSARPGCGIFVRRMANEPGREGHRKKAGNPACSLDRHA